MTRLTHEQLLGYLLGALNSKESVEVERAVAECPEVAAEFEKLRSSLGTMGLLEEPEQVEPPLCLAARTCEFVEAKIESFSAETVTLSSITEDVLAAAALTEKSAAANAPSLPKVTLSPVSRAEVQGTSLRKVDLVIAAAVVLLGASLCFPLLFTTQFQANITRCQNHLRQLGLALQSYSEKQPDGSFPAVLASGPRSVAGIYAPTLVSNQLIDNPKTFFCPGNPHLAESLPDKFAIPTLEQIDEAPEPLLTKYHNTMGGSYGYNLGYAEDDAIQPPRNSRRASFPLLADAPHDSQPGRLSNNHDRRGQNMLFEDGQVRFVKISNTYNGDESAIDDPYHNRLGLVAAGLDVNDAVLGRSNDPPIPIVWP